MKNQLKKQDIQNHLDSLKISNSELKEIVLYDSDARLGKLIALAKIGISGTVNVKTDFLTYSEMNQFLRGYNFKSENRFLKPY